MPSRFVAIINLPYPIKESNGKFRIQSFRRSQCRDTVNDGEPVGLSEPGEIPVYGDYTRGIHEMSE